MKTKSSPTVKMKCTTCGIDIEVKRNTYNYAKKKNPDNPQCYCKDCYKKLKADRMRSYSYNNLSKEDQEKRTEKIKETWNNKSEEELQKIKKLQSDIRKEIWNNLPEDEKDRRRDFLKNYYKNLSDKEKEEFRNKLKTSVTDRKRKIVSESISSWHKNMSKEEKEEYIRIRKEYYNNLSDEEKEEFKNRQIKFWENMTPEERLNIQKKMSDGWLNLTLEKRMEYNNKRFKNINVGNKLCKKFEKMFNESHLNNDYYIKPEVNTKFKYIHSWDYGIYKKSNNELELLVDIDGAYFHADKCDYNGKQSREEYDERRSLSIPNNTKWIILYENSLAQGFKLLIKSLVVNYNEYINEQFNIFNGMEFPYPHYTTNELVDSYSELMKMDCNDIHLTISTNTRLGDRLIYNFHNSIYKAHKKNNISPYDAWYNPILLKKCIENRIVYQNHLNPNKILQGFNISKIAPKVSVFSAGRAKLIINKYLNKFNQIFDPFSGFSGRMLGAIASNKIYVGQDISLTHVMESWNIINFLINNNFNIQADISCKDSINDKGEYECLFTCPPYNDKEIWENNLLYNLSCDEWIDICLNNFKCKRYVFVVDESIKYKDNIIEVIHNKSHFGGNNEYIIVIDKYNRELI